MSRIERPRAAMHAVLVAALALGAVRARAQTPSDPPAGPRMQIYGFVQLDLIQDFKVVNPDWADTLRPSKLPSYDGQFGEDGNFGASVKQSRFVQEWVGVLRSSRTPSLATKLSRARLISAISTNR